MLTTVENRLKGIEERMGKLDAKVSQLAIKCEHELPKSSVKAANKLVVRTEKKLVGLLKEQSTMIETLQSNYKEKLVSAKDSLQAEIEQTKSSLKS